ncbi:MAG: hypothetical protein ACI8RD_006339 [Bacillariaceae sp.]|jgi:hypothetical protein
MKKTDKCNNIYRSKKIENAVIKSMCTQFQYFYTFVIVEQT